MTTLSTQFFNLHFMYTIFTFNNSAKYLNLLIITQFPQILLFGNIFEVHKKEESKFYYLKDLVLLISYFNLIFVNCISYIEKHPKQGIVALTVLSQKEIAIQENYECM